LNTRLDLGRIRAAREAISPVFRNTPQFACPSLGQVLGCDLVIKLETANPIRCFKGRGMEVVLSRLVLGGDPRPVICASAGNLGQALAYSGAARGIDVTVVAGRNANTAKIDRIRSLGATVVLVDGDIEDARRRARGIAAGGAAFLVEDSENLDTCEGAGTIGLELLDEFERIDAILLALGGGALATGVGHVFKALMPATDVVCIQPAGAPAMALSWRARSIINTDRTDTIADGVAGRFPIPEVLKDLLVVADRRGKYRGCHVHALSSRRTRRRAGGGARRRRDSGGPVSLPRQARGQRHLWVERSARCICTMDVLTSNRRRNHPSIRTTIVGLASIS
jgi:threonine dehydratase